MLWCWCDCVEGRIYIKEVVEVELNEGSGDVFFFFVYFVNVVVDDFFSIGVWFFVKVVY